MQQITITRDELPYAVSEAIKSLRTNILFCGSDKKLIMLTSSAASEGKSTIALNLAISLAELGKKVLLLDTDLRRSELHHTALGKSNKAVIGLSHYLSSQADASDVLCSTNVPGLYMTLAGRVPPNPSELLGSEKMDAMLEITRDSFDYVIIDSAPIATVTDAAILATKVDGAIYVIKEASIPRKMAMDGIEQLRRANCPILGAIISQSKFGSSGKYYYNKYYKKYNKYYRYEAGIK